MKEDKPKINLMKVFDILFIVGIAAWVLFAWILPAVFNADNDVTMWMVFLTFAIVAYAVARVVLKFIQKVID